MRFISWYLRLSSLFTLYAMYTRCVLYFRLVILKIECDNLPGIFFSYDNVLIVSFAFQCFAERILEIHFDFDRYDVPRTTINDLKKKCRRNREIYLSNGNARWPS